MFDIVNGFLIGIATLVIAFLFLGIEAYFQRKKRDRWRPIREAPEDMTLVELKVDYCQQQNNPLFMVVDEKRDRLYNGDVYITIGYRKQNCFTPVWCAVGLTQDAEARFVHEEVCPTHFRLLAKPTSYSSH